MAKESLKLVGKMIPVWMLVEAIRSRGTQVQLRGRVGNEWYVEHEFHEEQLELLAELACERTESARLVVLRKDVRR